MHTLLKLYLGFQNINNLIINIIKLQNLPNNQYMGPYIFIHVFFEFKEKCPHLPWVHIQQTIHFFSLVMHTFKCTSNTNISLCFIYIYVKAKRSKFLKCHVYWVHMKVNAHPTLINTNTMFIVIMSCQNIFSLSFHICCFQQVFYSFSFAPLSMHGGFF